MSQRQLSPVRQTGSLSAGELLVAYCARPKCRTKFERPSGPGRPKDYCSDECRLAARDEQRALRSRLAHFESVVEQIRIDIAAFGRSSDDEAGTGDGLVARQRAYEALQRAEGALKYAPVSNPVTQDLRELADAIAPLLTEAVSRAS